MKITPQRQISLIKLKGFYC